MGAFAVVILALIVFSVGLYQLLKVTMRAYQEATGTVPTVRLHARVAAEHAASAWHQSTARISGAEDRGRHGARRGRRVPDLVLLLLGLVDRRRRRPLTSSSARDPPTLSRPAPVAQLDRASDF